MTRKHLIVARVSALALLCGVAACAHPVAGPNPQAGAQAPPDVTLASKPTVGQELAAVADNKVQVLFPMGGTALTPDAQHNLDVAARLFRDASPVAMFVAGYADPVGDEYSNLLLSARRAEAVKRGLVARGIPAGKLLLQAYGQSDPVSTAQQQAADNRRVVISWRLL